jgi:hypothetical protein
MRRKIERALGAEELAKAAQAVTKAPDAEQNVLDTTALSALRALGQENHLGVRVMATRSALICQSLAVISVLEASH